MEIQENYPLAELTTFRLGGSAKFYCKVADIGSLGESLNFAKQKKLPLLVLGGGSNILVSDEGFDGLVIQIDFPGIEILTQDKEFAEIKVGTGEVWDKVVEFAVANNLWGIENLSSIPGKTGATPVQNVGAYGQEVAQTISRVEVFEIATGQIKMFSGTVCGFGYRRSIFNSDQKGKYILLNVFFRLKKTSQPNIEYADVKKYFAEANIQSPSIRQVREAIVAIRKTKFPNDIDKIGNAGSFFKNVVLNEKEYGILKSGFEKNLGTEAVQKLEVIKNKFPTEKGIKIPTAFLIDICGLKGSSYGGAKLWEKQSLVIVNEGTATSNDVLSLYLKIKRAIFEKTGLFIDHETEFVGISEKQLSDLKINA